MRKPGKSAGKMTLAVLLGATAAAAQEAPEEVHVRRAPTEVERLRASADAVTVVETRTAKQETADLGEVLARTQGITVRRSGGLGSATRFSLNGFDDDQVRFYLDGVPLERSGYPLGVATVPVNAIERVDAYRGVVPIRLGGDALGGALDLVTDPNYRTRLGASYQVGYFGTYRATLDGRYRHEPTGFVFGGSAFVDAARNDYPVDVEATDASGRSAPARVRRLHDAYRAGGGRAEIGLVDQPWAKKLLLQGFFSTYDKDLQNNVVMTVPYGEARYGETTKGLTARYEHALSPKLGFEAVASYAHRAIDFVDESLFIYDWFGRRVRQKRVGGEIGTAPSSLTTTENGFFGRAMVKWAALRGHELRFAATPSLTLRSAEDAAQPALPRADRHLLSVVTGVEYQLDAFEDRLENVVFAKDYVYRTAGDDVANGQTIARDKSEHGVGFGDAVRWRFADGIYAKASYEYATRMPRADEVFGNGVLVGPNLELAPEKSHNANLGPRTELRKTRLGTFAFDVNAFLRSSDHLIVLIGSQAQLRYENVYAARNVGVENAVTWVSPRRWVSLDGMLTWQDLRNVAAEGTFGAFDGDRIPNRPYLFASWGARVHVPNVGFRGSTLEPFYHGRWVDAFYRGWESQGLKEFKQVVDAQLTHDVGLSWLVAQPAARIGSTLEIDNVTNARLYDFFGVQRPGRALFLKVTAEL